MNSHDKNKSNGMTGTNNFNSSSPTELGPASSSNGNCNNLTVFGGGGSDQSDELGLS